MAAKANPLKLNNLQLRTLLILQILAEEQKDAPPGDLTIPGLPSAHGDHYHVGPYTFPGRAMSGFSNPAVWKALDRKDLARQAGGVPGAMILTTAGRDYDTGLRHLLEQADHEAQEQEGPE